MILQQATMKLSKTENGKETKVNKLVMLWEEVGLCYHINAYAMNGPGYIIAHFNSGKIVLKYIQTKEQAQEYMQRLTEVIQDWTFTLGEYNGILDEDKKLIKIQVDILQQEILQKGV